MEQGLKRTVKEKNQFHPRLLGLKCCWAVLSLISTSYVVELLQYFSTSKHKGWKILVFVFSTEKLPILDVCIVILPFSVCDGLTLAWGWLERQQALHNSTPSPILVLNIKHSIMRAAVGKLKSIPARPNAQSHQKKPKLVSGLGMFSSFSVTEKLDD